MDDKGFEFPVDRSAIMLFARALRDMNPVFHDPSHPATKAAGGIIPPPTFVQSNVHWVAQTGLDHTRPGFVPSEGGGGGARGLHAEQHYEYHHPIHPGDTLRVTSRPGEKWEKEGRRGGKLLFSENILEFRNQDGVLCVTARSVGVQTEKAVEQ